MLPRSVFEDNTLFGQFFSKYIFNIGLYIKNKLVIFAVKFTISATYFNKNYI